MKRIAIYGKGGIGKSTISSNLTAALSDNGVRVMQIGCDPKHDSTRLLTSGSRQVTVLDYLKEVPESRRRIGDVVEQGYKGCLCVEAGGPEPGIGCAGRGIISAFDLLNGMGVNSMPMDVMIYDVLGDVVCGGFAVPLRDDYADTVYIVTSGEYMSIYAANNILRGTSNYDPDRIGGIIFNSRGDEEEKERVKRFSDAVGIPIMAEFSRSREFLDAERDGITVVEAFPDSKITGSFRELADGVMDGRKYTARYLSEYELERIVLGRSVEPRKTYAKEEIGIKTVENKRYTSRNISRNEVLHGCAFAGASGVAASITGLTTVLHSPRSCAQYSLQMTANSVRRAMVTTGIPIPAFADPTVHCTDMDESSMIFGGADVLEKKLDDLISSGNGNIAVITSCPSGIIGDDVSMAVRRIRTIHPEATIALLQEDGNINGDFMQGVIDASIGLMNDFSEKGLEKKKNSVNLVGVKTGATNCRVTVDMIRNILKGMDVDLNCVCVGNTDIRDLKDMSAAELSILLYPDRFALMLRDFLIDEYDLEFTENVIRPGLKGTIRWILEIASRFGKEKKAEKVIEGLKRGYEERMAPLRRDLKGRSIYVVGNHKDINWIMETVEGAGMIPVGTVVVDLSDHLKDYDVDVDYKFEMVGQEEMDPVMDDIRKKDPDIILSTYPLGLNTRGEECFIPTAPDPGPYSGPEMARSWIRKLNAPEEEGWRKDV